MHLENSVNSCLKRLALNLGIGIYEDIEIDIHTHILWCTYATRCAESKITPVVLKNPLSWRDWNNNEILYWNR